MARITKDMEGKRIKATSGEFTTVEDVLCVGEGLYFYRTGSYEATSGLESNDFIEVLCDTPEPKKKTRVAMALYEDKDGNLHVPSQVFETKEKARQLYSGSWELIAFPFIPGPDGWMEIEVEK